MWIGVNIAERVHNTVVIAISAKNAVTNSQTMMKVKIIARLVLMIRRRENMELMMMMMIDRIYKNTIARGL